MSVGALIVGAIVALGGSGCKTNPAGKVPADVSIVQYKSPDIAEITGIKPPDEEEPSETEPSEEPAAPTPAVAPAAMPAAPASPTKTPAAAPAKSPAVVPAATKKSAPKAKAK